MAMTTGQRSAMLARTLNRRDEAAAPSLPTITRGMLVVAADRQNYGRVLVVRPDRRAAVVRFRDPITGCVADVQLPVEWLTPARER